MKFKAKNLPENCPPTDSSRDSLSNIYRMVKDENDITENDFLTHIESGQSFPPHKECEANALSFFTTEKAVRKTQKKFKKFKNHSIICGSIIGNNGIHIERNEHINFWVRENVNIFEVFCNIQESEKK